MKTLNILLVLFFTASSYSQTYIPILDENNEWHIAHWAFWSGGFVNSSAVKVLGDEEINGKIYKKVYIDNQLSSCRWREENNILYTLVNGVDKIVLDFDIALGTILNEDFYCIGGGGGTISYLEVMDIYIDFIANENRKVIALEGFDFAGDPIDYFEYWIEGIGSTGGIVPFGYNWDFYDELACFTRNGVTTYFNNHSQCVYELGTEEFIKIKINLHQNPITSTSKLQFSMEGIVDGIRIFDLSGKLVTEEKITKDYFLIDATQYRAGMYFYQVYSENNIIKTERFIVL